MKSWRTITAAAVLASAPASVLLAGGKCEPSITLTPIFPLVMCAERQSSTSNNVGNLYPWVNSAFFFSTYRNQYLYPSSTLSDVTSRALTIESMHSRSVSFTGAQTVNFGVSNPNQWIKVGKTKVSNLVRTFSANSTGPSNEYLNYLGPKRVATAPGSTWGGGNALLSDFVDNGPVASRNDLIPPGWDSRVDLPASTNIMVDTNMYASTSGSSGFAVWDLTSGACTAPKRAYGSGSFVNPNHLTTAYGVDTMAFVWVFRGLGTPPPATMQQQIMEITRLLLTPQGLRCSGLDLTINGKANDDPLGFPDGKDYDPISPQIGTPGTIVPNP